MDCRSMADSNVYRRPPQSRTSGVTRRPRLRLPLLGTKRTFKVLRRRSDVEGRADMARTLPEGDPRYATDFLPRMDGAGCPPMGGAPQVHGGLGRAFARNYVRRNSLEYSGLRGEGSTPSPLPPPASH